MPIMIRRKLLLSLGAAVTLGAAGVSFAAEPAPAKAAGEPAPKPKNNRRPEKDDPNGLVKVFKAKVNFEVSRIRLNIESLAGMGIVRDADKSTSKIIRTYTKEIRKYQKNIVKALKTADAALKPVESQEVRDAFVVYVERVKAITAVKPEEIDIGMLDALHEAAGQLEYVTD